MATTALRRREPLDYQPRRSRRRIGAVVCMSFLARAFLAATISDVVHACRLNAEFIRQAESFCGLTAPIEGTRLKKTENRLG